MTKVVPAAEERQMRRRCLEWGEGERESNKPDKTLKKKIVSEMHDKENQWTNLFDPLGSCDNSPQLEHERTEKRQDCRGAEHHGCFFAYTIKPTEKKVLNVVCDDDDGQLF